MIERVRVQFVLDEEVQLFAQVGHEFGAGRDRITVKQVGHLFAARFDLSLEKGAFACTFKPSRTLLIHLGSRSDSIDRKENIFLGLHQMHDFIDGLHDGRPQLLHVFQSADALVALRVIAVDAIMDDTIQIQVQVI